MISAAGSGAGWRGVEHSHEALRRFALGATLLAGCAVGPDFVPPPAPDVHGYTPEPLAQRPHPRPTRGRRSAALRAAISTCRANGGRCSIPSALNAWSSKALAANPDLQAAQAALRVAQRERLRAARRVASRRSMPTSAATRQLPADRRPVRCRLRRAPTFNLFTAQLNISYSPDVFGGTRRSIEALRGAGGLRSASRSKRPI